VTATEYGLINVFNYPVEHAGQGSRSYAGHSEYALRV